MKHGHYFVSLSGATDSDVRDTAGGKSGTAPGKTEEIFALPVEKGEDRHPVVTVSRTEYFFPDYHLVRVSVARTEGMDKEQAELKLREQLQELTEDPDHTYVVCREPLSFISEGNSGIICNRSGSNICCATGRDRAAIRRGRIWSCWGEIRICLMSCSAMLPDCRA